MQSHPRRPKQFWVGNLVPRIRRSWIAQRASSLKASSANGVEGSALAIQAGGREPQITQIPQIFSELILRSALTQLGNLRNRRNPRFLTGLLHHFEHAIDLSLSVIEMWAEPEIMATLA